MKEKNTEYRSFFNIFHRCINNRSSCFKQPIISNTSVHHCKRLKNPKGEWEIEI